MFLYILAFLCTHVYMCMCSIEDPASPWEWHILRTKPFRSKPWPLWGKPFFPAKGVPTWPENCDSQNVFWWSRTPVVTEIFLSVNFESWLVWQILTQQNSDQWKHIDWWASCTGPENAPSPFFPSSIGPVPTPGQDWPGVPARCTWRLILIHLLTLSSSIHVAWMLQFNFDALTSMARWCHKWYFGRSRNRNRFPCTALAAKAA